MRIVRLIVGAIGGLLLGAALGFGVALVAMAVDGSHQMDGTFGMIEVFTMVPVGAVLGLLGGALWGLRRRRPGPSAR